jgi:hypothetical protein
VPNSPLPKRGWRERCGIHEASLIWRCFFIPMRGVPCGGYKSLFVQTEGRALFPLLSDARLFHVEHSVLVAAKLPNEEAGAKRMGLCSTWNIPARNGMSCLSRSPAPILSPTTIGCGRSGVHGAAPIWRPFHVRMCGAPRGTPIHRKSKDPSSLFSWSTMRWSASGATTRAAISVFLGGQNQADCGCEIQSGVH